LIAPKTLLRIDFDPVWLTRIFTAIPAALILLAGAGAIWIYFFALSLLPQGESLVETPGLTQPVKVVRDSNGIPTIFGQREEDVATVLGYVMAQDRLWQMDYLRRAGQGRLAEILGFDYLDGDHLIRTVRAGRQIEDYPGTLDQNERRWVESFVQGINRYIAAHAAKLPVEFSLLGYKPAIFRPEDILSICFALAWESSLACRVDAVMTRVVGRLGKDRGLELFPSDPSASARFFSSDLVGWEPKGLFFSRPSSRAFERVPAFRGGCLFAVAGDRTQSGKPVACTSVYQTLTAPGFWYRAHLLAGNFRLSGAFIPGVPAALVGTNKTVSWGSISTPADDADLFIELLDGDPPKRFWKIDHWRNVQEIRERYRVRGGSTTARTILVTETGPLVSELRQDRALSLRWTGHQGLGFLPAMLRLNRAHNGDELKSALKVLVSPCLDVIWASHNGTFGVQSSGKFPLRCRESDGIVPLPAWTGIHDWQGFLPFAALPSATNPAAGFLVIADGRPGGPDYPHFLSSYWSDDFRVSRIKQVLEENPSQQRESLQRLQNDSFSPIGMELAPVLLRATEQYQRKSQTEREALDVLTAWDYQMTRESAGAAVFGLFYQALVEDLFRGPLGDSLYDGFTANLPLASRVVKRIFIDNQVSWLHGTHPDQVLVKSFQKAVSRGNALMGSTPARWGWGEIHSTVFVHPLAIRSRFLKMLYTVGPIGISGSADTINFAGWSQANPIAVREGVTLRHISDMTDPPQLFAVSPLGSSAHFFSAQYKNQTRAWVDGRGYRESIRLTEVSADNSNAVFFKPQPTGPLSLNQ
jgi:penicillin G amidase